MVPGGVSQSLDDLVRMVSDSSVDGLRSAVVLGRRNTVAALFEDHGFAIERVTDVADSEWAAVQLARQYAVVVVESEPSMAPEHRIAQLHCGVQHVLPGGLIVAEGPTDLARFGLIVEAVLDLTGSVVTLSRRTQRVTIHDMVFAARQRIGRVRPDELDRQLKADRPPLVVDTRTHVDRARFGVIPGSIHVPRTVLEWHLDPANGYRHASAPDFDDPIVVVCNGGYSSSLAAANLVTLGFTSVADLIGGHRAWCDAGLPVAEADHSHLDL